MGRFGAVYQSIAAIPIVFYGSAFHRVSTSLFQVPFAVVDKGQIVPSFGIFVGLFACFVALAVFFLGSERVRKVALPVGVASQLIASLLVALVYYRALDSQSIAFAGGVLGSFATALLSALWIDLYARLNPVRAVWCGAVALLVSQALVFLVEGNALYRVFIVLACAPLLSLVCFLAAVRTGKSGSSRSGRQKGSGGGKASGGESTNASVKDRFLLPYKAVAFIAAYSFAYGFARMGDDLLNARYAAVVPSLIVVCFLLINDRRFNVSVLLRFAFPLMVAGFLLVFLASSPYGGFASIVVNVGFATMEMLLLFMVCTISYSTGTSGMWLFGVLCATQSLMRAAGVWLGSGLNAAMAMPYRYELVSVVAIVMVVLASVLLMSEKSLFSFWRFRGEKASSDDAAVDYVKARIGSLGELYSLTDREKEVFHLLAQGKSNIEIAHDMFISEGTVKAHLHHIYTKLDVRGRKELVSLLDSGSR